MTEYEQRAEAEARVLDWIVVTLALAGLCAIIMGWI
jgi:hypothetical protein